MWIVPGYVVPINHVAKGWQRAGTSLSQYVKPQFYTDIANTANTTWRWGAKEVLMDYTVQGVADTWQTSMAKAKSRTQKRVFGWWLAYPWASFESSILTVLRVATGLPIGVAVTASAYTLVPTVGMVSPVIVSVATATIEGTAYPVVAASWNTLIAPPLALFGQQPAPERADGFWMRQVDDPRLEQFVQLFSQWQLGLAVDKPSLVTDYDAQIDALRQQLSALEVLKQQQQQAAREHYFAALLTQVKAQRPLLLAALENQGLSLAMLSRNQQQLKIRLAPALRWSDEELNQVLAVLIETEPMLERASDDKTDPLQRSLDLIKQH
ncbi:hypothetical protein [Agitococcus lubricus]|uniref:Uncharacterized protein n=1 Tax=Agitococcus lubricus TaxID=1077255 RepID=A0A2T5J106_9GAMM|nr:hypothetical protein [Agitococcus lubricus]PTQ90075.1 hypothetical protein C8N29_104114 [Agitococcus lubricus]